VPAQAEMTSAAVVAAMVTVAEKAQVRALYIIGSGSRSEGKGGKGGCELW
jgi:hypothetical protein